MADTYYPDVRNLRPIDQVLLNSALKSIKVPTMNADNYSCFDYMGEDYAELEGIFPAEINVNVPIPDHYYLPCSSTISYRWKDNIHNEKEFNRCKHRSSYAIFTFRVEKLTEVADYYLVEVPIFDPNLPSDFIYLLEVVRYRCFRHGVLFYRDS